MAIALQLKVAVIGAGIAGLATAKALKAESHEVVVYEKSDQIGGLWVYDPRVESDLLGQDPGREIIHSSLYPSLKTNLPRQVMGFLDYPFNINDPDKIFPGHAEVLEFINDYAEDFGLIELIRFNTEVVMVEPIGPEKEEWVVESKSDGRSSKEVFDAVVVCTGHVTKPRLANIPDLLEKWNGKQLHSHNYRGPEPYQDKVVVVIGLAASGIDISKEIATVAKEVHISVRRKPFFKVESWGDGNVRLHSEISGVSETGEVSFYDQTTVHPDIILHCTGYEYDYPFLKIDGIVTVDDNRVGPLYKHILSPIAPRLSFIGLNHMSLSIPTMDMQAKWLSKVLSGKVNLSKEDMLAEVEQHYMNMMAKELPKRHTHYLGFEACVDYMNSLATEAGLPLVDDKIRVAVKSFISFLIQNSDGRLWKPEK